MSELNQVHDRFFKAAIAHIPVAREFFQQHLPDAIQALIDFNTLHMESSDWIKDDLGKLQGDTLYSAKIAGHTGYLTVLIEQQTDPQQHMPFRFLQYMTAVWQRHLKQNQPAKTLPVIIPLLFYTGQRPYDYSLDILDLFDDPTGLMKDILFKPIQLIEAVKIPDQALQTYPWAGTMQWAFKYIRKRDLTPHIPAIYSSLSAIEQASGGQFIYTWSQYLFEAGKMKNVEEFVTLVNENVSNSTGDEIMTLAQRLLKEGEQKGKLESKVEIAKTMLKKGINIPTILELTGLPFELVGELQGI